MREGLLKLLKQHFLFRWKGEIYFFYKVGPILPLPLLEKKVDFSPVWVTRKVPRRKSTGTATKSRVAAAPKFVVSIETNGYSEKLSLSGPKI